MPFIELEIIENKKDDSFKTDPFFVKLVKPTKGKRNVLLVGEVQSGKTRAIEQCIFEGSAYYDAVIVFGGTNTLLNNQTYERFWESKSLNKKNVRFFTARELLKGANVNSFWDKKIFPVMIVLKGQDSLKKINEVFEEILIKSKRVLVIDDESDYASINIGKKGGESQIYKQIQKLLSTLRSTCIEVTATPFANVLSSDKDYNCISLLKPNEGYTGSDFFMKNREKYHILDSTKKEPKTWEKSVERALLWWLISTAIYSIETNKQQKSEFLINIDLETPTHTTLREMIIKKLKTLSEYPSNILDQTEIFMYFKIHNTEEKKKIVSECKKIINDIRRDKCESVVTLNKNKPSNYKSGSFQYSIVIGGALVSRGFTFEHLITELILNSPDENIALDTMLQRARWFGYRFGKDNMQKYMNIFLNKKIMEAYQKADETIKFFNKNYCYTNLRKRFKNFYLKELKPLKINLSNKK